MITGQVCVYVRMQVPWEDSMGMGIGRGPEAETPAVDHVEASVPEPERMLQHDHHQQQHEEPQQPQPQLSPHSPSPPQPSALISALEAIRWVGVAY
jgi:hypothetical protein